MSAEKNLTSSPSANKPVYCGVGSCDKTPVHGGIHRCRCGKPVNEPAPHCAWHRAPEVSENRTEWGVRFPAGTVEVFPDEAEARRFAICTTNLRPDLPTLVVRKVVTDWEVSS